MSVSEVASEIVWLLVLGTIYHPQPFIQKSHKMIILKTEKDNTIPFVLMSFMYDDGNSVVF